MATAYTSLLGLALPVTGELSGTWGDTVNNSITSLLDTSIAGTTNVSTDADVTLTTTTGASNTSRQAILLFSGSRTVLRTVTAPAQSKIYTVINATTGGFSVKLVGVGPTTGVTIVAGESAICAWNGSDFVKVSNTGGAASFTNVTVTGTTTLSGLTASTALALDASKNVVSVTNTGSGSNVLATSPTLVTPALGTPSALVGTNITGTATSFNINGTVGATTPATGAFTTISASGAITTTLATGTAPLVVASTTKVANLNVDSLDGADWASPAALGSTTPAAVSATTLSASGNLTLSGGTANGVAYLNGSKVLTTGSALTFDGGNLGLGVTPSAWVSTSKAIQIGATGALWQSTSGFTFLSDNAYVDSGATNRYITTNFSTLYRQQSGQHNWFTAASGTAGNAITFTQAMTLDASGNLIVGGTAATNTSSGRGNITINGSSSAILSMGTGGTEKGYIYTQGTDFILNASSGAFQIATGTAQPIIFQTDNTERARIDSSGNLLVGNTAGTGYRLNVKAAFSSTLGGAYIEAGEFDKSIMVLNHTNGSVNVPLFQVQKSGTGVMTLDASGNLGIGTSSPTYKLVVSAAGASGIEFGPAYSGTANLIQSYNRSGSAYVDMVYEALVQRFNVSGTEKMRLTSTGLGIGTTTPSQKLEVVGSAQLNDSGTFYLNNSDNTNQYYWQNIGSSGAGNATLILSRTNAGETLRIDAGGKVLIGTTTNNFASRLVVFNDASYTIESQRTTTASEGHMAFVNANGAVGSIFTSGTATSFNTSSDYRLKNTIAPMTGALAKVALLKPCTYKWNADGSDSEGFIAHELAEVVPQCVTGEKDAVDADGKPQYQGIDTSFLVATLTAAIQEQQAIIESLKARLDAANL